MEETCQQLRNIREQKGLSLRHVANLLNVDVAILSKLERGERKLSKEIVIKLAKIYEHDVDQLLLCFLTDKIIKEVKQEELGERALQEAVERINYLKKRTVPSFN